jgi:hypothetical protein
MMIAAFLFALLAPAALALLHDHRHCTHPDCAACYVIRAGIALIRIFALALIALIAHRAPLSRALSHLQHTARIPRHITPVSLKVKMTN